MERQVMLNNLDALQTSTQSLLQYAEEGSAIQVAAFVASQSIAAASVFVQGEIAAANALAAGGPVAGPALAASVRSLTLASMAAIAAQTVAGLSRAQGGDFAAGDSVMLGERGREVVTFDQPGTVKPNSSLQGDQQSGNVVIQQNIVVQGNGDEALTSAMEEAARRGAERGYQAVYKDFKGNGNIRRLSR